MIVVLIRHTSVDVPPGTCYGWSDVPVKDTFVDEAEETRLNLQKYPAFDHVYCSPLTRARLLAAYCLPGVRPTLDPRLKEMNMGDWEMQRYEEIDDPHLQEWYDDYMHQPTTNGESFPEMYARVASFLDELRQHDYERVAIFAHGGVLICAGIYAGLYAADEHAFEHITPYGGAIEIEL